MSARAAVREVLTSVRPSRVPVDAGGVPAEWVEVAPACPGQQTLVCFPGPESDGAAIATMLALRSSARVLLVPGLSVEGGVMAWAWLLHEGCDTATTGFVGTTAGSVRAFDVLAEAQRRGLPLPEGGVWTIPREVA
jgi:hypothetical protein